MHKRPASIIHLLLAGVFCLISFTPLSGKNVDAAPLLGDRFIRISNPRPSASSRHNVGIQLNNITSPLGSVRVTYCSNSPLIDDVCVTPNGLNLLTASLQNQVGNFGFTIDPSSTNNEVILSRFPILPTSNTFRFDLNGVINPSDPGTHYARIQTYSSDDGSGSALEEGGIALSINGGFDVSAEVPPYLKFCVGTSINDFDCATATTFLLNLGVLSPQTTATASSQFVVATNAGLGYNVTMAGTTLTSGNNIIPGATNQPASAGVSRFGVNLRANSNPSVGVEPNGPGSLTIRPNYSNQNIFRFITNESIAFSNGVSDNKKATISYVTNVSQGQPAGVYATTLSFICLANF